MRRIQLGSITSLIFLSLTTHAAAKKEKFTFDYAKEMSEAFEMMANAPAPVRSN